MKYTEAEARKWADDLSSDLSQAFKGEGLPPMFYMGTFKQLMNSGYWLQQALRDNNIPDDEIKDLQFIQGQKAFGCNPWLVAVQIVNERLQDTE